MEDKMVVLQNKRSNDFIVNYPYGERGNKEYKFMGTKGSKIYEKAVPLEVVEWLSQNTRTFDLGYLFFASHFFLSAVLRIFFLIRKVVGVISTSSSLFI